MQSAPQICDHKQLNHRLNFELPSCWLGPAGGDVGDRVALRKEQAPSQNIKCPAPFVPMALALSIPSTGRTGTWYGPVGKQGPTASCAMLTGWQPRPGGPQVQPD